MTWSSVVDMMKGTESISLGYYLSYCFRNTPRRILYSLSYYKFAAKLIGKNKKVLDVGCNEGLGTYLIAKECGQAKGIDYDTKAIQVAKSNFDRKQNISFVEGDFLSQSCDKHDAVINFDVIEHIFPDNETEFMEGIKSHLTEEGLAIIGTPSEISQQFASPVTKKGHVNVYSPERLEALFKKHFSFVFMFYANDEVIHTGFPQLAHYLIAVGSKKK